MDGVERLEALAYARDVLEGEDAPRWVKETAATVLQRAYDEAEGEAAYSQASVEGWAVWYAEAADDLPSGGRDGDRPAEIPDGSVYVDLTGEKDWLEEPSTYRAVDDLSATERERLRLEALTKQAHLRR